MKKLFSQRKNQVASGEVTNSYLFSTKAASNIKQCLPNSKIIMVLRNPISRAYSHYLMDLRTGVEHRNFRDALIADINKMKKDIVRVKKKMSTNNI